MKIIGRAWLAALPLVWIGLTAFGAEGALQHVPSLPLERATVELHAHLFMKQGLGWLFKGEFDGPLRAQDWTARLSSEANPETLDRSELAITVATLYAHPLFVRSLRDSVRAQIAEAERFVAEHPHWVIARSAAEARAALAQGKRVMVLALEGAHGILETEEDLREFVDQKGVRIVTLLHFTDDPFGGVAFMRGVLALSTPWAWAKQLFGATRDEGGVRLNATGLRDDGRAMTRELIKRGVWIDLAHASDASMKELIELQGTARLPLLVTHTSLRAYHGAERGISAWGLAQVRESGGIVGVMPSEDMLEGTPSRDAACAGGVHALATQYAEMAAAVGAESVMIGSDYNGGVRHLRPTAGMPPACRVGGGLDDEGLWNIGQTPELWGSLEKLGLPVPKPRRKMVDRFLEAWEKVTGAAAGKDRHE